ncbi:MULTISPECIES: DNA translocase FtsK 4TM domain-containing protein [unclassified Campylobacter]|uniref:FtsK/SpoIIIE family DNA translocase n=1 Tax=unclassified Campylobacter TaxID=2593542 RepID=UPI003D351360
MADFVGSFGQFLGTLNLSLFGLLSYIYPFLLIALAYFLYKNFINFNIDLAQLGVGSFLLGIALLMFEAFLFDAPFDGIVGKFINDALNEVIGKLGTFIIIMGLFVLSISMVFKEGILSLIKKAYVDPNTTIKIPPIAQADTQTTQELQSLQRQIPEPALKPEKAKQALQKQEPKSEKISNEAEILENVKELVMQDELDELEKPAITRHSRKNNVEILNEVAENKKLLSQIEQGKVEKPKNFELPSLKFLADPPKRTNSVNEDEIDQKISDLLDKLRKFKINGDVVRTYTGPIVTTFEFKPAPDVKVSKILTLQDDLAMALKAQTIRIQAPIPGKDVVGIEVPNKNTETIYLKEILESDIFKNAASPLTMALGKDIVGAPFITDLKKLPHLLIAGTTGSGKSVGINAMLLSLLYRNSPQTLRLMMIDPKMLEFSIYNDIPHLLTPVITQAKQAITALSNMVAEMERRYSIMSHAKVKNIESYNEKMKSEGGEQFPYIVVIIDELADLMMTSGKDVELYIGRLAQMARASGIHLIVATQRPSVDVVTGLIKANLPSRVSYRVGQRIDSKVILDQMGAESLLGRGDMLFTPPGSPGVIRLHAPFASEKEIENIVEFLKAQQEVVYDEKFLSDGGNNSDGGNIEGIAAGELDELYEQAKEIVLSEQKTSISYLQRRLGVGYNRSANILEQMERMGVLSTLNAKGQREIL